MGARFSHLACQEGEIRPSAPVSYVTGYVILYSHTTG